MKYVFDIPMTAVEAGTNKDVYFDSYLNVVALSIFSDTAYSGAAGTTWTLAAYSLNHAKNLTLNMGGIGVLEFFNASQAKTQSASLAYTAVGTTVQSFNYATSVIHQKYPTLAGLAGIRFAFTAAGTGNWTAGQLDLVVEVIPATSRGGACA